MSTTAEVKNEVKSSNKSAAVTSKKAKPAKLVLGEKSEIIRKLLAKGKTAGEIIKFFAKNYPKVSVYRSEISRVAQ